MMENRKKVGLLIIIAAALMLAIIIIMFLKKTEPIVNNTPTTPTLNTGANLVASDNVPVAPTSTPGDAPRNYQTYDISKEAPYILNANDASQTAALFAEVLGSFSNQSNYENVTSLEIYMTPKMKDWSDTYVAGLRAQKYTGEYSGITTQALTKKVLSYDEKAGKAKIEVQTQRQEQHVDTLGASFLQKMTVDLVKVNNEWRIDAAFWEK